MSKLKIIQNKCYIGITENIKYAEKKALCKYRNHPSLTISKTLYYQKDFLCQCQSVSIDKVKDIMKTLNIKKACSKGDVPLKLIKINEDIFSRLIFQNFDQSLVNGKFRVCLKQAEAISVFKMKKNFTNPTKDL